MSSPAGGFKWQADDYVSRSGKSLLTPDWLEKEIKEHNRTLTSPPSPLRASLGASRSQLDQEPQPVRLHQPQPQPAYVSSATRGRRVPMPPGYDVWGAHLPPRRAAPPPGPDAQSQLHRVLSSPSTLTFEGLQESRRVLGAATYEPPSGGAGWTPMSAGRSLEPIDKSKIPKTSNQQYGSRATEADPKMKRFPKSTCDVCVFVDNATKTKTPYNASIRF
mmetsp:Transcript_20707/g.44134  ORF Transcript_20707/g.44134 Transcript_20707/m.44134 type:complete len:219 (+) Transcript_20707:62-718(+)